MTLARMRARDRLALAMGRLARVTRMAPARVLAKGAKGLEERVRKKVMMVGLLGGMTAATPATTIGARIPRLRRVMAGTSFRRVAAPVLARRARRSAPTSSRLLSTS
jgi:hypothetical protein